jgi:signal transduction histidine kinase/CheY-like chemotaxis protein/NO-binding membrane sensor protein with MHYT domain
MAGVIALSGIQSVEFAGHDIWYVLLAAVICATAGSAASWLHGQHLNLRGALGWAWIGFHALAAGSGVWAANVLALLGFRVFPLSLQAWAVGLSLVLAVLAALPSRWMRSRSPAQQPRFRIAGLMALSFVIVHYTALAGVAAPGKLVWSLPLQGGAVLTAFALALAACLIGGPFVGRLRRAAGFGLVLAAIGALHFISMAGLTLAPSDVAMRAAVPSNTATAALVATVALFILGMAMTMSIISAVGERKALRRLRIATNAMPSALALFDEQDRLVVWNTTFEFVMGPRRNLVREGMPLLDLIQTMPGAPSTRTVEAGPGAAHERISTEFQIPDGKWIRVDNVPTEDGGLLSLGADVTHIRSSEAALAEALDRAEAANQAKSDFLATMSHEIRTPLNGVLGMAQAMEKGDLSPPQRERLEVIQSAGEALLSLLNDMLDISKIEAARIELEDGVVDLEAVAGQVVATFSALAGEKDICVTLDVSANACGCWRGDPGRVRQVLQNLVSNAVKFTDRGAVNVDIGHDGSRLVLRVADTGPGIPIEQQARVFDSFAQADASTTRRYGGSGLGLSISRALVELMGGEIVLDSKPGQGSTFTVRLPLTQVDRPVAIAEPQALDPPPTLRILAAEDNPMNQLVLRTLLDQGGLQAVIVGNGEEALRAWEAGGWDVILMDVQMPVMDGPTATRRIREIERSRGGDRTPIIALTANAMSHHQQEYLDAGMDLLVAKPIRLPELFAALKTLCEPQEETEEQAVAS